MTIVELEQSLVQKLPSAFLKDVFPRGMRRLAEMGLFRKSAIVSTKFGFHMMADRLDAVKWYVYYFRQFEPQISLAWSRLLQSGDVVVDIGGNVGYHALLAATCVGPKGRVVTVEPSRHIHLQLLKNIELNGYSHVTPLRKAVSNAPGTVSLYYAGDNVQGNSSFYQTGESDPSEDVDCITVDQIGEIVDLAEVKLFKIDVEGAEPLVLESLQSNIAKLHPDVVIFVEISPQNTEQADSMLAPFLAAGFHTKLIANEYTTQFYRETSQVEFRPADIKHGTIHDVVMTRNPKKFEQMSRG